jgi:hypothetical protein
MCRTGKPVLLVNKIVVIYLLLMTAAVSLSVSGLFVQSDIKASPDCEDADVACTVEELREYCRDAYPNNELGWYKCMNQVQTPNPGD